MAMSHTHRGPFAPAPSNRKRSVLWLPIAVFTAGLVCAALWVTWLLWPRWPAADMALDAPSLPITVNGVNFNIPPAAIRNKMQRKPGTQERVDLMFRWPSLEPPDPAVKAGPVTSAKTIDRVFLTIANYGNTLPLIERFKTIYPRYLEPSITTDPGGLSVRPFRDGTPYQGEELNYDSGASGFLVRCTRNGAGATLGMCLYDRRIGAADITIRFPRDWLEDWPNVVNRLDRLIVSLRANGG